MSKEVLKLEKVNKYIGQSHIINDLSFSVKAGEVFGFLGPNGAGKTSTIRMIVGLNTMSSGDIYINGFHIKKDFKNAIRGVGAIVENPELYPFMTGYNNLKHFAKMNDGVTKERILEVADLVGLTDAIHMKVKQYSLGMRQRLGIAVSILHHPSVLILDEPTNGLDPAGIKEIRHYIRMLAEKENVAIIISSHLLSEIELMCDRIGVIKNGQLVTTQNLKERNLNVTHKYVLKVATPETALEVLKTLPAINHVSIKDEQLHLQAEETALPGIISTLVSHHIALYTVIPHVSTLEERFFEMIGDDNHE